MKWDYSAVCLEPLENRCLLQGLPIISIDASQPDVSAGSNAALVLTSDQVLSTGLSVPLTLGGTAVNGVDVNTLPTVVVFQPGTTSQSVPVTIINSGSLFMPDTVLTASIESGATFDVNPAESSAEMFINHAGPRVSVTGNTPTNGLSSFTLRLNSAQNSQLIVPVTITGSVVNGVDISLIPDFITLPPGRTSVVIPIQPLTSGLAGQDVTLTVTATSQLHVNRNASSATVILGNETVTPTVAVVATQPDASEDGQTGAFVISRTGDVTNPLTVPIRLSGSAREGINFQPIANPVVIPAGENSVTVTIIPINDNRVTTARTVVLSLVATPEASVQQSFSSATVSIADVSPVVSVVATDPSASESGNPGTFTFTRTGDTTDALPVTFKLGGSARNGVNFETVETTVLIPAGDNSTTLTINPIDVDNPEKTRTVTVNLANTTTFLADTTARKATVTITSDASVVSILAIQPNASESGVNGVVELHRAGDLAEPLTIKLKFSGSARNGKNYETLPKTVTFDVGEDTAVVTIVPINDNKPNKTRTAVISLAKSSNYQIASAQKSAKVFIADAAPGLAPAALSQWRPIDDQFDLLSNAGSAATLIQPAVPLVRLV